jgi:hypothetical protein
MLEARRGGVNEADLDLLDLHDHADPEDPIASWHRSEDLNLGRSRAC